MPHAGAIRSGQLTGSIISSPSVPRHAIQRPWRSSLLPVSCPRSVTGRLSRQRRTAAWVTNICSTHNGRYGVREFQTPATGGEYAPPSRMCAVRAWRAWTRRDWASSRRNGLGRRRARIRRMRGAEQVVPSPSDRLTIRSQLVGCRCCQLGACGAWRSAREYERARAGGGTGVRGSGGHASLVLYWGMGGRERRVLKEVRGGCE